MNHSRRQPRRRHPRRGKTARRGSILMEFLLVAPVFLTILGGLIWIGDLGLTRQKNMIAERYAAYNMVNRYRTVDAGTLQTEITNRLYYDIEKKLVDSSNTTTTGVGRWKKTSTSRVSTEVAPMTGLEGMLRIGELWGTVALPTPLAIPVAGSPNGHTVLFRGDHKYELEGAENIDWKDVQDDPWWP